MLADSMVGIVFAVILLTVSIALVAMLQFALNKRNQIREQRIAEPVRTEDYSRNASLSVTRR